MIDSSEDLPVPLKRKKTIKLKKSKFKHGPKVLFSRQDAVERYNELLKQSKSRFSGAELYLKRFYCDRNRFVPALIAGRQSRESSASNHSQS
jgi:hypothetical protein